VKNHIFFTLNPNGNATDLKWFPEGKEAACLKEYFLKKSFLPENLALPDSQIYFYLPLKRPVVMPLPTI
jgi:hypothetical protein